MRKALSLFMALLLITGFVAGSQGKAAAQSGSSATTTIIDTSGNESAQVTVDSITDPFEGYDSGYEPQRGFRYVLLTVTVENTGALPFYASPYGFSLVDADGFIATTSFISYLEATVAPALADATLEVGDSVTGSLAFQMLGDGDVSAIVYSPSYDRSYILASNGAAPLLGDTAILVGEEGGEIGTITVNAINDPMTDFDPGYLPPRGYRYVSIEVTIENTGGRAFSVDPGALRIIDGEGFVSSSYGVYRTEEAIAASPDIQYVDLAPGESLTGIISYSVFTTTTPAWLVWFGPNAQYVITAAVAGADAAPAIADIPVGAASTRSTPTVDETAAVDETAVVDGTATTTADLSPECQDLSDWSDDLNVAIETLNSSAIEINSIEDLEALTPDVINEQIDLLNDFIDNVEDIDTPESAEDASDALVAYIEVQIDGYDDVADAKDDGDDLQPIYDEYEPKVDAAAEVYLDEFTKLGELCPTV